jgi:hypothetical protein
VAARHGRYRTRAPRIGNKFFDEPALADTSFAFDERNPAGLSGAVVNPSHGRELVASAHERDGGRRDDGVKPNWLGEAQRRRFGSRNFVVGYLKVELGRFLERWNSELAI